MASKVWEDLIRWYELGYFYWRGQMICWKHPDLWRSRHWLQARILQQEHSCCQVWQFQCLQTGRRFLAPNQGQVVSVQVLLSKGEVRALIRRWDSFWPSCKTDNLCWFPMCVPDKDFFFFFFSMYFESSTAKHFGVKARHVQLGTWVHGLGRTVTAESQERGTGKC